MLRYFYELVHVVWVERNVVVLSVTHSNIFVVSLQSAVLNIIFDLLLRVDDVLGVMLLLVYGDFHGLFPLFDERGNVPLVHVAQDLVDFI